MHAIFGANSDKYDKKNDFKKVLETGNLPLPFPLSPNQQKLFHKKPIIAKTQIE